MQHRYHGDPARLTEPPFVAQWPVMVPVTRFAASNNVTTLCLFTAYVTLVAKVNVTRDLVIGSKHKSTT